MGVNVDQKLPFLKETTFIIQTFHHSTPLIYALDFELNFYTEGWMCLKSILKSIEIIECLVILDWFWVDVIYGKKKPVEKI